MEIELDWIGSLLQECKHLLLRLNERNYYYRKLIIVIIIIIIYYTKFICVCETLRAWSNCNQWAMKIRRNASYESMYLCLHIFHAHFGYIKHHNICFSASKVAECYTPSWSRHRLYLTSCNCFTILAFVGTHIYFMHALR